MELVEEINDVLKHAKNVLDLMIQEKKAKVTRKCVSDLHEADNENGDAKIKIEEIEDFSIDWSDLKIALNMNIEESYELVIGDNGYLSYVPWPMREYAGGKIMNLESKEIPNIIWTEREHIVFYLLLNAFGPDFSKFEPSLRHKTTKKIREKYHDDIIRYPCLLKQGMEQPLFEDYDQNEVLLLVAYLNEYIFAVDDEKQTGIWSAFASFFEQKKLNTGELIDEILSYKISIRPLMLVRLFGRNDFVESFNINLPKEQPVEVESFKRAIFQDVDELCSLNKLIEYLDIDLEAELNYFIEFGCEETTKDSMAYEQLNTVRYNTAMCNTCADWLYHHGWINDDWINDDDRTNDDDWTNAPLCGTMTAECNETENGSDVKVVVVGMDDDEIKSQCENSDDQLDDFEERTKNSLTSEQLNTVDEETEQYNSCVADDWINVVWISETEGRTNSSLTTEQLNTMDEELVQCNSCIADDWISETDPLCETMMTECNETEDGLDVKVVVVGMDDDEIEPQCEKSEDQLNYLDDAQSESNMEIYDDNGNKIPYNPNLQRYTFIPKRNPLHEKRKHNIKERRKKTRRR